jgi:ribosomal protein S18 acetylase RimI-like enzyme
LIETAKRGMLITVIAAPVLTFRTIDPLADAALAVAHRRSACVATYGDALPFEGAISYLRWLRAKVEEFPDGFVLAMLDGKCVGQMELEVPYGLPSGYVSLFYVAQSHRRHGLGRLMHQYADRYFKSWEAREATLHVSPKNRAAIAFYRAMQYQFDGVDTTPAGLWRMTRTF